MASSNQKGVGIDLGLVISSSREQTTPKQSADGRNTPYLAVVGAEPALRSAGAPRHHRRLSASQARAGGVPDEGSIAETDSRFKSHDCFFVVVDVVMKKTRDQTLGKGAETT